MLLFSVSADTSLKSDLTSILFTSTYPLRSRGSINITDTLTSTQTRALLRLERTMNLLEGGEGRMGERGWGRDGGGGERGWGGDVGERGRVGREGG